MQCTLAPNKNYLQVTKIEIRFFSNGLSQSKPDLLEPISFGSEVRLLALEQELQDLREQISTIVKTGKQSASRKHLLNLIIIFFNAWFVTLFLEPCLSNGNDTVRPPPPPPPLPPPTTPHIARRASLQEHMTDEPKKPPLITQKSMGDMLKDIEKIKLRPIARYKLNNKLSRLKISKLKLFI